MTAHRCVRLGVDGSLSWVFADHSELACLLGGDVTFVGAVDDLQLVFVATTTSANDMENPFPALFPDHFMVEELGLSIRGDIIGVGSDARGMACDLHDEAVGKVFVSKCSAGKI